MGAKKKLRNRVLGHMLAGEISVNQARLMLGRKPLRAPRRTGTPYRAPQRQAEAAVKSAGSRGRSGPGMAQTPGQAWPPGTSVPARPALERMVNSCSNPADRESARRLLRRARQWRPELGASAAGARAGVAGQPGSVAPREGPRRPGEVAGRPGTGGGQECPGAHLGGRAGRRGLAAGPAGGGSRPANRRARHGRKVRGNPMLTKSEIDKKFAGRALKAAEALTPAHAAAEAALDADGTECPDEAELRRSASSTSWTRIPRTFPRSTSWTARRSARGSTRRSMPRTGTRRCGR